MKTVILSGREIRSREALHGALKEQLSLPDWYGGNLDALYDCLTEQEEPVRVIVSDRAALEEALEGYFDRLLHVLQDANAAVESRPQALEEDVARLLDLQRTASAYGHAMSLIYYDGATTAPRDTAENRAQTMGVLSQAVYDLTTGEETAALLDRLEARREALTARENRMVFLLQKDLKQMRKIPREEYVALQRLLASAEEIWRRAKEHDDFAAFAPTLEKIFAAYRRIAGLCAPEMAPYDYWLDQFEEGLSMARCDEFFAALREHIVPLLRRVQARPQLDNSMLHGHFPQEAQAALSDYLMDLIGLDRGHVGLATTEHPFTTSLGSHLDERITTHYYEEDFSFSMYSVIHEGGHALYDTGSDESLAFTALDCGVSMGIHESQSRFYENLLGRSLPFCQYVLPKLQALFPELEEYSASDLYRAVNRAEPSLIRTEADELTYCLHVMIRYELEKQLFDGTLTVEALPAAWNALYKEYLGIDVPDDRRGVLQDSHWSGGNIGYFPSYALGSAYGAQLLRKMRETVDVDDCLRRGDFGPINEWNQEHIWKYGRMYGPGALFAQAAGAAFDPKFYTDYLEEKFSALYGLD